MHSGAGTQTHGPHVPSSMQARTPEHVSWAQTSVAAGVQRGSSAEPPLVPEVVPVVFVVPASALVVTRPEVVEPSYPVVVSDASIGPVLSSSRSSATQTSDKQTRSSLHVPLGKHGQRRSPIGHSSSVSPASFAGDRGCPGSKQVANKSKLGPAGRSERMVRARSRRGIGVPECIASTHFQEGDEP